MGNDVIIGLSLAAFATLIGSAGALFFKYASKNTGRSICSLLKKPHMYLGLFLYGISALIFVFSLKFGDLSVLYPVAGLSYVWVCLLSVRFLKEKMNDVKWFGIFLIILGVILASFGA